MITLNNSNIDFDIDNQDLGSKYSITLSEITSNLIFKTQGNERMTIQNNGNIGIGKSIANYNLDINGTINADTYYVNGENISIITRDTSTYARDTSNVLIGRIRDTSNYVRDTSNILIRRVGDTSNYVRDTSNILIRRVGDTSNYVRDTSNILVGHIRDTSNYVRDTSNILVGHISDTSNYVRDTSNILTGRIVDTSDYIRKTSNILIGHISDTNNYVRNTSNILVGRISNTSNYVNIASNILIGSIVETSNYVINISNILISNIVETSNYIIDAGYILIGSIFETSNYVIDTSNILIGRIPNTSNYVIDTSNILVDRIKDTSNYVRNTSNILVGHISDTSNYVRDTSNILAGRIVSTSNYIRSTNNILIGRINDTSNYIKLTKDNILVIVDTIPNNNPIPWIINNNILYYNTANIGVGTTNPDSKLHIYENSTVSPSIELIRRPSGVVNIDYSIGNYNGNFKIRSSSIEGITDRLVINSNGNVGIGTTNANYTLEVFNQKSVTFSKGYYLTNNAFNNITTNITTNICAKFNGSIWVTGACYINSDIRTKEDIQDINDDSALLKLLAIEPKTYKYIDKIEKGDKKVYGFIAQQIQEVIPEAIGLEKSYIPNIMLCAEYYNKIITLPYLPTKVTINVKDKIKCFDINNSCIEIEVTKILNELAFEIKDLDKEYKSNKIFVYGTYVSDFHTLSKEHIFSLNVGATQELYRLIKNNENIIKSQEERMNILEKKNEVLNKEYDNLLEELELVNQNFS